MKIILWSLRAGVVFVLASVAIVVVNLVFIGDMAQLKQKLGLVDVGVSRAEPLLDGVIITEVEHNRPPLPYDYGALTSGQDTGDVPGEFTLMLQDDGRLLEGQAYFDHQIERQRSAIEYMTSDASLFYCLIQQEQQLFFGRAQANEFETVEGQEDRLLRVRTITEPFADLSHWGFSEFSYWAAIDQDHFLMVSTEQGKNHWDDKLWQINRHDLSKTFLADKPYFTHAIPPKVFQPPSFDGSILVHYTDSVDYAFGGDSSRPKYSTVRVFTPQFPEGQDVVKLGFEAGMVVDVSVVEGQLELLTDPSLPAMADKPRVPPRIWQV